MRLVSATSNSLRAMSKQFWDAASGIFAGWLLMQPPLIQEPGKPDRYKVDLHAPIEQWIQISAHDNAAECERRRRDELTTVIDFTQRATGKTDVSKEPIVDAGSRARCVPADHIYPPKQGVPK